MSNSNLAVIFLIFTVVLAGCVNQNANKEKIREVFNGWCDRVENEDVEGLLELTAVTTESKEGVRTEELWRLVFNSYNAERCEANVKTISIQGKDAEATVSLEYNFTNAEQHYNYSDALVGESNLVGVVQPPRSGVKQVALTRQNQSWKIVSSKDNN